MTRAERHTETTDSHWRGGRRGVVERMTTGERPALVSSAGTATERAVAILDDVILRAAAEGGVGFAAARAIVCALFLAREIALGTPHGADVQERIVLAILAFSVLISVVVLWTIPRVEVTKRRTAIARTGGTLLDAVVFLGIISTMVVWPGDSYRGLLAQPYVNIVALVIVAAGLRLERLWVLVAFALNTGGVAFLVWLDHRFWPDRILYTGADVSFELGLCASACIVGVIFADRARALALRGARRAIDAARAREKLGQYLGREVAEEALLKDDIVMGGKRQPVAVLFSDLRGFTTTAETLPPEELVTQLNAYLEDMVRVIVEEGGVVDKYIGDGIMAVFGAPRGKPDDAWRAVRAARRMQAALEVHNRARASLGQPPLHHGVGGHFGVAVAGNVGTREHAQYTIVGDVVNVAARLEGMTKELGVPALLSSSLVEAARAYGDVDDVAAAGPTAVRGRSAPVETFTFTFTSAPKATSPGSSSSGAVSAGNATAVG